jgi:hypothetical protein
MLGKIQKIRSVAAVADMQQGDNKEDKGKVLRFSLRSEDCSSPYQSKQVVFLSIYFCLPSLSR